MTRVSETRFAEAVARVYQGRASGRDLSIVSQQQFPIRSPAARIDAARCRQPLAELIRKERKARRRGDAWHSWTQERADLAGAPLPGASPSELSAWTRQFVWLDEFSEMPETVWTGLDLAKPRRRAARRPEPDGTKPGPAAPQAAERCGG